MRISYGILCLLCFSFEAMAQRVDLGEIIKKEFDREWNQAVRETLYGQDPSVGAMCFNRKLGITGISVRHSSLTVAEGRARELGKCRLGGCSCRWFRGTCMVYVWGRDLSKAYYGVQGDVRQAESIALERCYRSGNESCYRFAGACSR